MVPDSVLASWRHQRGETGDKVFCFKVERRPAVPPWVPQREDDAVFAIDTQAGQGYGRTRNVPGGAPAPVEPVPAAKPPVTQAKPVDPSQARSRAAIDRAKRELRERLTTAMAAVAATGVSSEAQASQASWIAWATGAAATSSARRCRDDLKVPPRIFGTIKKSS